MPPGSAISHFILNTSNSSRRPCFLQSWDKGGDIRKEPLVSSSREVTGSHVVNGEETHEVKMPSSGGEKRVGAMPTSVHVADSRPLSFPGTCGIRPTWEV